MAEHRAERRLAAILVADVVGYSRLMANDEIATHERVTALRKRVVEPCIAAHRGRVVKLTGDGVLAEFVSALEAIDCAAAIQRDLAGTQLGIKPNQQIWLRIGINVGDVIAEEGDIYGGSVNIAERLQTLSEPGGICISQTVYDHIRDRTDYTFAAAGKHKVKNIPQPILAYRMNPAKYPDQVRSPPKGSRATIAVLPFENLAGNERWDRLALGICEDIITDLARHADLSVIARSTTFAYRGHSIDVRQVGRELGVRYVLEGSIQAGAGRIRVTAQLIDADTGMHVWAERYDRAEADLLVVQDEIVQQVSGSLLGWEGRISQATRRRARHASQEELEAYELYLLAYEAEAKLTGEDTRRAIELADAALALDPTLARAWLVRGYAWNHAAMFGWVEDVEGANRSYRESMNRAHELDPSDGLIQMEMGDLLATEGNLGGARAAWEKAAQLAVNHGDTLSLLAKYFAGTFEQPHRARTMMDRAFLLNPDAPPLYFYNQLRVAYLCGDFATAVAAARRSPDTPLTKVFLAMALAQLGREAESQLVVEELRSGSPEFDAAATCKMPWLLGARAQELVLDGLAKIGLPVPAS